MSPMVLLGGVVLRRAVNGIMDELTRSFLKTITVLGGSCALLVGVYGGSKWGLEELLRFEGVGEVLAARIPGLVYLVLALMLTMSSAVTFLGVYFRASETAYLHTLPAPRRMVFLWRWIESLLLSSWAFPAIVFPFHVALWGALGANLWYLGSFAVFLPAFASLTTTVGALLACGLVALGPLWRHVRLGALIAVGACLAWFALHANAANPAQLRDDPVLFLQVTLARFRLGFSPFFPSGWWYLGGEALRAGDITTAAGYFLCLSTSALLLLWVLLAIAPGPLYRLWTQWSANPSSLAWRWPTTMGDRLFGFLRPPLRALVVKDLCLIIRDPSQWAQTILLFGLMGVYVASLKGMAYHNLPVQWRLMVVTANLAAVAGILASLGARFFFPMPSLESRMAWVVRLAPLPPEHTLWAKVALAMLWTLPPALAIAIGTIVMLDLPAALIVVALFDVALFDVALMSMSVGFGFLLPELGQDEPARIVSGFGGTAALLVGLAYVLVAAILVWLQVGWVPWVSRAVAHRIGTLALGGLSLGISTAVLHAAARRIRSVEIAG